MGNAITHPEAPDPGRKAPARPDQSPAESPDPPARDEKADRRGRWPPDSLPNPMPEVDPQQTPGIDRLGDTGPEQQVWARSGRAL
ncbi:hypothetical protein A7P25_07625 [Achromobacter xylosoxidans]|uniref:Uncharacterized protein n=1 Tax=Achromobacter ruhlandii TaxID=72557 RepID=A0A848NQ21_9BURK|nr:hypothetical protein [Achromobacter ruhlandii]AKP90571.1 hypothetical protein Axylo_3082 [Achromobacter xylosoxidans]AOU93810.1 uncharacterized protein AruCF_2919 [Achromobacter ruhlandii]MCZ8432940.1 hypothetical protein [Achromobacter ruhlandii]MDC6090742.1 hypothetical protein [Achromobacter ruhlandii]MDC6152094.1 hypothetical protein [Achromobacter ruhlandii]